MIVFAWTHSKATSGQNNDVAIVEEAHVELRSIARGFSGLLGSRYSRLRRRGGGSQQTPCVERSSKRPFYGYVYGGRRTTGARSVYRSHNNSRRFRRWCTTPMTATASTTTPSAASRRCLVHTSTTAQLAAHFLQ